MRLHRVAFAVPDLSVADEWAKQAGAGIVAWADDDLIHAQQYVFAGGGRLEFLNPKPQAGDSTPVRRFLRRNEPRIHHLTILVDDFDVVVRRLRSRGFPVGRISQRWSGWREGYLAPADTGDVLVQVAWHGGDDATWARTVNHVPEAPAADGLVVIGAKLRHKDTDRAREIWEFLGGQITPSDWNEFQVDWPAGNLRLSVERGESGPAGLLVDPGPSGRPLPDPHIFGPVIDVTAESSAMPRRAN